MGSNGGVATAIPIEGDCLVFCEWPSQGITSFIVDVCYVVVGTNDKFCEQSFSFTTMESKESLGHEGQQHRTKQKQQRRAFCPYACCKGLHLHNESIIRNHMIKWGPLIIVNDVSFI